MQAWLLGSLLAEIKNAAPFRHGNDRQPEKVFCVCQRHVPSPVQQFFLFFTTLY